MPQQISKVYIEMTKEGWTAFLEDQPPQVTVEGLMDLAEALGLDWTICNRKSKPRASSKGLSVRYRRRK